MTEPVCPFGAEERAGLYLAGLPWCPHVSEAELADLERRWRKAMERPRRVKLIAPRRVRARIAWRGAIDHTAIWLIGHHCKPLARLLWCVTGMMRR